MKGWYGQKHRHSLASKGIRTGDKFKADGKRRFRKGNYIEVKDDYSFREPFIGSDKGVVTVKKGDVGKVINTHKDDLETVDIRFKTQDGEAFYDQTDKRFITGKFRIMKKSNPKDKKKIEEIYEEE